MNRRAFACGLTSLIAGVPSICAAQLWRGFRKFQPWRKSPSIAVLAAADDVRLSAVYEAVAFWNAVFVNLGTPFRLGSVAHRVVTIPRDELRISSVGSYEHLERSAKMSADIYVVLSDIPDRSFAAASYWVHKVLVVIGSDLAALAPHPNGLQNMIAHEFGHAIGLDHNTETTGLMCGGGASCDSRTMHGGFLLLTRTDKLKILEMYPPDWQEEAGPSLR
jgi:hypothetical protein